MRIEGFLYDGKTSTRRPVIIEPDGRGGVRVQGDSVNILCNFSEIKISQPLGSLPRLVRLPDGSQIESFNHRELDELIAQQGKAGIGMWLHLAESKFVYSLLALIVTLLAMWIVIAYGTPVLAKHVAFMMPSRAEEALGSGTLEALDSLIFKPSSLPAARKLEIEGQFKRVIRGCPEGNRYRLMFRQSAEISANALALPSGIVVMTDDLIHLAQHDEELIAVLAHEVGHLCHRHSLRMVLQNSMAALIVIAFTGDASIMATILPSAIINARYSRDFEREADRFATQYLEANGITPKRFADILSRLEESHKASGKPPAFLSSHPSTKERMDVIRTLNSASPSPNPDVDRER